MSTIHSTIEYAVIPGCSYYRATSEGVIQSCRRHNHSGKVWKGPWKDLKGCFARGYVRYVLWRDDGTKWQVSGHVAAMLAFRGPCPNGMEVLHWDDDGANNRLSNLRYGTRKQNIEDAIRNGGFKTGERSPHAILTEEIVREIRSRPRKLGDQTRWAREFGVHVVTINAILKGKTWKQLA